MPGFVSATDIAIRDSLRAETLCVEMNHGRFGIYWAIVDSFGVIEIHFTYHEARERIESVIKNAKLSDDLLTSVLIKS